MVGDQGVGDVLNGIFFCTKLLGEIVLKLG